MDSAPSTRQEPKHLWILPTVVRVVDIGWRVMRLVKKLRAG